MSDTGSVTVRENTDSQRFEVFVGAERAGTAHYEQRGAIRTFTHTFIDSAFERRGLGSVLAQAALDDSRTHGYLVVPRCPFIAAYIREHPAYLDLLVDRSREGFHWGGPA